MARYRNALPQLSGGLYLSDGGLETTLVFHKGIDLPCFASCELLRDEAGREVLRDYFREYLGFAVERGAGFILESATWRANPDWAARLGYSDGELDQLNREAIGMLVELRGEYETPSSPLVISGCIGPRADGYVPGDRMTAQEAEDYHGRQIGVFRDTEADLVSAFTMNYVEEAIGITRAARAADIPAVISFTLETDGRLPTGQTLRDAIEETDAATGHGPAYYMINCAHPSHFDTVLARADDWTGRIRGLRANASCRSHAELDEAEELDEGNPAELGAQYRALKGGALSRVNVLGGCCGTDHRHVHEIYRSCAGLFPAA